MPSVEIVPATADRFDDVTQMLNPRDRSLTCWCMSWRPEPHEDAGERGEHLRTLTGQDPAPGLLACLPEDGPEQRTVVGWLGLAPRSRASMLQRSRVLPRRDPAQWATSWVVMCFLVRPGYRRRGVALALLHGAVDYAREHGATVIEGFPVDPGGERVGVTGAYVGTTGMFEQAGFDIVEPTSATSANLPRWVARRELA